MITKAQKKAHRFHMDSELQVRLFTPAPGSVEYGICNDYVLKIYHGNQCQTVNMTKHAAEQIARALAVKVFDVVIPFGQESNELWHDKAVNS